jgi:hypothetical protein
MLVIFLSACRDAGAERWSHAHAAYESLLNKGERVESKAFDSVLVDLDAVPADSHHFAEAQKLAATIRKGRIHLPVPLAVVPKPGSQPALLEAQMAACARLAELVGVDGGVDQRALVALEACRKRVNAVSERLVHEAEPEPPTDQDHHP